MYQPGDIFLVSGHGFFSRGIMKFTQAKGEPPSRASHVGIVVSEGDSHGPDAWVVEALGEGVVHHPFAAGPGRQVHAVYRPLKLSPGAIAAGVAKARACVGQRYGWGKIATQALDFLIPWRDKQGQPPYAFRRLAGVKSMPICSYLVDEVVTEELLYDARAALPPGWPVIEIKIEPFGVPRNTVTPDDIMDFCEKRTDLYQCVRIMGPA